MPTIKSIVGDVYYDIKHKTDTTNIIMLDRLEVVSEHKGEGVEYCPSNKDILKIVFEYLKLNYDVKNMGFLDFGCGKGRVLLSAQKAGFKKIVGVDFSPELCAIAKKNTEKLKLQNIEVVSHCATTYQIPQDIDVIYLYNPFNGSVMSKVVENIKSRDKKSIVVYVNPTCRDMFRDFNPLFEIPHELLIFESHS